MEVGDQVLDIISGKEATIVHKKEYGPFNSYIIRFNDGNGLIRCLGRNLRPIRKEESNDLLHGNP